MDEMVITTEIECPCCADTHTYDIIIRHSSGLQDYRSRIIEIATKKTKSKKGGKEFDVFTLLLKCPKTQNDFKRKIELPSELNLDVVRVRLSTKIIKGKTHIVTKSKSEDRMTIPIATLKKCIKEI